MANSYLSRSESSAGSSTKGTFSAWIKRSKITSDYPRIFSSYIDNSNHWKVYFDNTDRLNVYGEAGGSLTNQVITTRKFRDVNGWYHIVVAVDSTQGSSSDRVKVYVNGVQETAFDTATYPSSSANMKFNGGSGNTDVIGKKEGASSDYFDGYLSHISWVDGAALVPTSFGQTDSTSGIWKFKSPTGLTWGTNGFHLKMENSGALGTDSSGNSNTFAVNGNLKQALDTPSNVYATFNPLDNYYPNHNFSNANTTITHPNASNYHAPSTATMGVSTGKWYWENKFVSTTQASNKWLGVGVTAMTKTASVDYFGKSDYDLCYYSIDDVYRNNAKVADLSTWTVGDIIGVALDVTNSLVYFYKNGVVENSGTGFSLAAVGSSPNGVYRPAVGVYDSPEYVCSTNFGNGFFGSTAITSAGSNGNGSLFEYDVPSGFYALTTKNINTYG